MDTSQLGAAIQGLRNERIVIWNEKLEATRKFYDTEEWRQLFDYLKRETIEERVIRYHRNCGSHSNIPSCCVEFFIKYWRGGLPESWVGHIYSFLKRVWYPANRRPAYVPCLKCFIKRYAQPLYECDKNVEEVGVGNCQPTGRVYGFYSDAPLPDMRPDTLHR